MADLLRIAAFGDVVGAPGRRVLEKHLPALRESRRLDLVVVNAENIAEGSGVTPALMDRLLKAGADVLTTGDHIGRKNVIFPVLEGSPKIVRPANYPPEFPGRGLTFIQMDGFEIGILNLIGRIFMHDGQASCPFKAADEALARCKDRAPILIVDFHAEATSEKVAMGWYLDGRASIVYGSHTHVATADGRVLPKGTAYQTDIGMCGPWDSVIGRRTDRVLKKMITGVPAPFDVAEGDPRASGAIFTVEKTGRAVSVERLEIKMDDPVPAVRAEAAVRA
ncbi:MAG TPA: TIGR00282 family metallophosphoesterase [Planctomycetota bacterium]|nr:TIGR00282 family metallophosphoesterase [Planctomycetota bacterium]